MGMGRARKKQKGTKPGMKSNWKAVKWTDYETQHAPKS